LLLLIYSLLSSIAVWMRLAPLEFPKNLSLILSLGLSMSNFFRFSTRFELTKSYWSSSGSPTLLMTDIAILTERAEEAELQTCPAFTAASVEWHSRSVAMWN
jgi:hypothetical protein